MRQGAASATENPLALLHGLDAMLLQAATSRMLWSFVDMQKTKEIEELSMDLDKKAKRLNPLDRTKWRKSTCKSVNLNLRTIGSP